MFYIEALSVIIQVLSRYFLGRKVFAMAPILCLGLRADASQRLAGLANPAADHFGLPGRVILADRVEQLGGLFQFVQGPGEILGRFQLLGGAGRQIPLKIDVGRIELRCLGRCGCLAVGRQRQQQRQCSSQAGPGFTQSVCNPIPHARET